MTRGEKVYIISTGINKLDRAGNWGGLAFCVSLGSERIHEMG